MNLNTLKEHRTVTHRTHKIRHCQKKLSVADGKCMKNTTKEIPRCSNSSSYVVSLKKIILLINPDLAWITEAFECHSNVNFKCYLSKQRSILCRLFTNYSWKFHRRTSRQEWLMVDERTPAATTCISDCSFGSILFRLYVLFLMVTCSCKNLK